MDTKRIENPYISEQYRQSDLAAVIIRGYDGGFEIQERRRGREGDWSDGDKYQAVLPRFGASNTDLVEGGTEQKTE